MGDNVEGHETKKSDDGIDISINTYDINLWHDNTFDAAHNKH